MCTGVEIAVLASAAISAVGSISAGNAQARAANFQATVQRQQAERQRQIAAVEAQNRRKQGEQLFGAQRARFAAAGIDPSAGTPLALLLNTTGDTELDALTFLSGGLTSATRLEQQAQLSQLKGKAKRDEGFLNAGTTLLNTVGKFR